MSSEAAFLAVLGNEVVPYVGQQENNYYPADLAKKPPIAVSRTEAKIDRAMSDVPEPVIKTVVPDDRQPTLHELLKVVSEEMGIGVIDIMSPRRSAPVVRARHIYYYVAKLCTSKSLVQIGKHCADRDHTTVLHGIRKVERLRPSFDPELSAIMRRLGVLA